MGVLDSNNNCSSLWRNRERKMHGDDVLQISVPCEDNVFYMIGKLWDIVFTVTLNYFSSEYYYSILPTNFDDVNVLEIASETESNEADYNDILQDEDSSEEREEKEEIDGVFLS